VQPNNTSGLADNSGDRNRGLKLFNNGASVLSLDGYYLATSLTNLGQWAFPPAP